MGRDQDQIFWCAMKALGDLGKGISVPGPRCSPYNVESEGNCFLRPLPWRCIAYFPPHHLTPQGRG